MQIDQTDLKIVRALEQGGRYNLTNYTLGLGIPEEEVSARTEALEAAEVIKGYRPSLFLPPLLGGDWNWAAALMVVANPETCRSQILEALPYPIEFIHNQGLPPGIAPNLVVLFYTQDLTASMAKIEGISGIDYFEVYRIGSYSFPVTQGLSRDEFRFIKAWGESDNASDALTQRLGKDEDWLKAKIERLSWRPDNPGGVLFLMPNLDFSKVENFLHTHFLLEGTTNLRKLKRLFKAQGIQPVPYHSRFRSLYYQVEADLWGFKDLIHCCRFLTRLEGLKLRAMLYWEGSTIESSWISSLQPPL
jgi:DNA-binding Lrp family transcriptional regulator